MSRSTIWNVITPYPHTPMHTKLQATVLAVGALLTTAAQAVPLYLPGVSPSDASSGLTFGTHVIGGPHTSVGGVGGGGLDATGSVHDGARTYIWDLGAAADLADGVAKRSEAGFAMMIWDMAASYDSLRLYTHQDHYSGGPVSDPFVAQDLMEYSVWGSHDGDNFVLLSDVTGFDVNGGGAGNPTYTFAGTEPSVIYRGGSTEYGILNAYTREYVFGDAYQYFGIRTSTVSLVAPDADPELDAIAAFNIDTRPPGTPGTRPPSTNVPDNGTTVFLQGVAVLALAMARRIRGS